MAQSRLPYTVIMLSHSFHIAAIHAGRNTLKVEKSVNGISYCSINQIEPNPVDYYTNYQTRQEYYKVQSLVI